MFLDGQLPYGPPSSNPGAPASPPLANVSPPGFFTLPEGGDVLVSPTLGNADGVVQVPQTAPASSPLGPPTGFADCGSYGAASYNVTIASGKGRGLGSMCQSGPQSFQDYSASQSPWPLLIGLGLIAVLLGGNR
jgi:hypothetical protein